MKHTKERLLETALQLETAQSQHFTEGRTYPHSIDPEHIKIIKDTALRARLIAAGLAEGLQSPKGPQKIASIIRLYPNGDAPKVEKSSRPGVGRPRGSAAKGKISNLPTIEQMEAVCQKIRQVEEEISGEVTSEIERQIEQLKQRIGSAHVNQLHEIHSELGAAIEKRSNNEVVVRREALRRVAKDTEFPFRGFVSMLAN